MERDAPWTAWIRMIQLHDEAAAHPLGPLEQRSLPCGSVIKIHLKIGVLETPKNNLRRMAFAHYTSSMKTKSKPSVAKRGRPPGSVTKRINARFPAGLAEKIEYAASLRGVAVSAFIQDAVAERADRVIESESHWQLTRNEAVKLAEIIAKPPKPNQAMLKAAKLAARHVVIRS
jgi:uncharacterized protein (DUF1778 family)